MGEAFEISYVGVDDVDVAERLLSKVQVVDECWVWTGSQNGRGYGQVAVEGVPRLAHRVAYETFVGVIPEGLHLDHLCSRRLCIRPRHLEPVTPSENNARSLSPSAFNGRKTSCAAGHPYDRVYVDPHGQKHRYCSICLQVRNAIPEARRRHRDAVRRYRARHA